MKQLPTAELWNGVGCGGSQKCELATADERKWDYDELDVVQFLRAEFPAGCEVDAQDMHKTEKGESCRWERCRIKSLKRVSDTKADQADRLEWKVVSLVDGRVFDTKSIRHPDLNIQHLLESLGQRPSCRSLTSPCLVGNSVVGNRGEQERDNQRGSHEDCMGATTGIPAQNVCR